MPDRANQVRRVPENQAGYREANTAFLRAEIRETRERMSGTLDELSDRLNPTRIKTQVKENIREATVGRVENMARNAADRVNETRHGMMDTIRENPIPAAMVGIGLGWLLFGSKRRDERTLWERSHASGETWDGTTGYVGDVSATTPRLAQDDVHGMGSTVSHDPNAVDRVKERMSDVGETMHEKADTVRYQASQRVGEAKERVGEVKERVGEKAHDVADRARNLAHNVSDTTRQRVHMAGDRLDTTLHDNPVAIGMVAMAVGMAAGLAIPESRRERELMGQYRDQLGERVRDRVEETRDKVKHVAERVIDETKDAGREAARAEGLMS